MCILDRMNGSNKTIFKFLCLSVLIQLTCATTSTEVANLLADSVFTSYDKRVRPRTNQDDIIYVSLDFGLTSISGLDEIGGTLSVVGYLEAKWDDELIAWTGTSHTNVQEIQLTQNDIWTPAVTLYTSVDSLSELGESLNPVTITQQGSITWKPGLVIDSGCSVDVSLYPFDTQKCSITFIPWQFTSNMVRLLPNSDTVNTDLLSQSSEWSLLSTSVANTTGVYTEVTYELTMKRRPQFFILNMILPILLIGLLNGFVFIMPFDQGRVGFIITGFLSIAVFLTIIADILPKSSNPMSLLGYFLVWQLMLAALCTLETIITLKIYHRDGKINVPSYIKKFLAIMWCYPCRGKKMAGDKPPKNQNFFKKTSQLPIVAKDAKEFKMKQRDSEKSDGDQEDSGPPKTKVTWKMMGASLDTIFFFVFVIVNIAMYMMFLAPLASA